MKISASIITVTYNSQDTIIDTLISVASQKAQIREHIIIDGFSSDNTLGLIKDFKSPNTYVVSEPDNGIYDAMNKGLRIARGEVIGFLNSDDVYAHESVLNRVLHLFDTYPEIDIVYGDLIYVKTDSTDHKVRYWKSQSYYTHFFEDGYVPPHPSFFARSHVFKKAGAFDLNFKLAADYELMFRMLKQFKFKSLYIPEVLVHMRLGGVSNNSLRNVLKGNTEIVQVWRKHKQPIPLRFWVKRYLLKVNQHFA